MVIGNGNVARVLPKQSKKLFFASGVSDSGCTNEREFAREVKLLLEQPRDAHLVYFGSMSIFYSDTPYARHKRYMEVMVKENFPTYCIMRLGNLEWDNNPKTLINYLRTHPKAPIRDEYRYVISKKEFLYWVRLIPKWSVEMNCPGRWMKVQQIKETYV